MDKRVIQIIFVLLFALFGSTFAFAQAADATSPLFPKENQKEQVGGLREMLEKMRIEREKKDHEDMIRRGQEALDLSNELEKAIESEQKLTPKDIQKLDALEKLVKKIRGELGGGDDVDNDDDEKAVENPSSIVNAFKNLRSATVKLVDELKKTTRFSISAAAIKSSNSVLRIARFLRFWK